MLYVCVTRMLIFELPICKEMHPYTCIMAW